MGLIQNSQDRWVDNSDYPTVSQADTLSLPAIHFWDMHETGSPSVITDIVNASTIACLAVPVSGGIYVNVSADETNGNVITGGKALGDDDFMLLSVARSVAGTPADNNGHTGFYWVGPTGTFKFKNHSYYAMTGDGERTIPYSVNWVRTAGWIYTHALVRRGTILEHYCLPKGFVNSYNMLDGASSGAGYIAEPETIRMGHGGYGTPYNGGVGNAVVQPWITSGDVGQDYAGEAVYRFSNGAPSMEQIVKCLRWSENEWTTKSSGKRLYPGFIGL